MICIVRELDVQRRKKQRVGYCPFSGPFHDRDFWFPVAIVVCVVTGVGLDRIFLVATVYFVS